MPHLQNVVFQVEIVLTPWLHPVTSNFAPKISCVFYILKYAAAQIKEEDMLGQSFYMFFCSQIQDEKQQRSSLCVCLFVLGV